MSVEFMENATRIAIGTVVLTVAWMLCVLTYAIFKGDE